MDLTKHINTRIDDSHAPPAAGKNYIIAIKKLLSININIENLIYIYLSPQKW